jgi:hypothetical protein
MNIRPDKRLEVVLLLYLESVERGRDPDVAALLGDEPELAAEVGEFVDAYRQVARLTAPVRTVARRFAAPGPCPTP